MNFETLLMLMLMYIRLRVRGTPSCLFNMLAAFRRVTKWVVVYGVDTELPEHFGDWGVTIENLGPTNKEKLPIVVKKKYFSGKGSDLPPINRPELSFKHPHTIIADQLTPLQQPTPKKSNLSLPLNTTHQQSPSNESGPSKAAYQTINNIHDAMPVDFINLFFPPKWRAKYFTDRTNMHATIKRIEIKISPKYNDFSNEEIDAFIGLLFANGLSPRPQIRFWFNNNEKNPLFGNNAFQQQFSELATDKLSLELCW